jgi:hypothetical protein
MPEDYIPLSQQFWALLLELEKHLVNKRKEQSLPQSVAPQEPQLFSLEDLKQEAQVTKINKAGWSGEIPQNHFLDHFKPKSYFFPTGYTKGTRFKGRGARGKSYGRSFGGTFGYTQGHGRGFGSYTSYSRPKPSKGGKWPSPKTHSGFNNSNGTHSGLFISIKDGGIRNVGNQKLHIPSPWYQRTSFGGGKILGINSSLSKVTKKIVLVGATCLPPSCGSHKTWDKTTLGSSPPLVNKVNPKGGKRFATSTNNFKYLSRVRSNQSGGRFQFKTSNSMVFDIKTRGGGPNGD